MRGGKFGNVIKEESTRLERIEWHKTRTEIIDIQDRSVVRENDSTYCYCRELVEASATQDKQIRGNNNNKTTMTGE